MSDRNEELDSVLHGDATPSLYSVLDEGARKWWYHEKLRKNGEVIEARKKERNNIRQHIIHLKRALTNGGYATISQDAGTFSVTYSDNAYVSGGMWRLVAAAYLAGLPVLDWREVKDSVAIFRLPMGVMGDCTFKQQAMADDIERLGDLYPTPFSHVPLARYMEMAKDIGASIHLRTSQ